jgi:hypothetical protein
LITTFKKFARGAGMNFRAMCEKIAVLKNEGSPFALSRLSVFDPSSRCSASARSSDTLSDRFDPRGVIM